MDEIKFPIVSRRTRAIQIKKNVAFKLILGLSIALGNLFNTTNQANSTRGICRHLFLVLNCCLWFLLLKWVYLLSSNELCRNAEELNSPSTSLSNHHSNFELQPKNFTSGVNWFCFLMKSIFFMILITKKLNRK